MPDTAASPLTTGGAQGYRRIATEEAFAPPEMLDVYRRKLETDPADIGFASLMGHYLRSDSERAHFVRAGLQDLGDLRLRHMDEAGIDHAVLALTSPGTQALGVADAKAVAALANDRLAEACAAHPNRLSGLAAVGFDDAPSAVEELTRGVRQLGLKGLICNSHINGHYLDEPRFFPILEAVEALDVPLYLHPNTPSNRMIAPFVEAGVDGAIFGFGVETSLHLLRMITAGVLDRFPGLRVVVGHLGEALPYWFYRLDYMHAGQVKSRRYDVIKALQLKPSEYFQRNIWLTTSGMPWAATIMYARSVMGADRVMYAMDYPYEYVPDEVRMQDDLPLSPAEKKQFFQDTAIEVFGLDAAAIVGD